MPNNECLSCGTVFSSRKKLSSHKPHCEATEILTRQVFEQGWPEKHPHHDVSPMLSDADHPERGINDRYLFEPYGSHEDDVRVTAPLSQVYIY
jgi:hypothetical protein